jgi:uncharacterized protein YggE
MMKRFAIAFVVIAAALGSATAQERMPSLITVTGEGEVAIVPDLAIMGGGVTTAGKTAREASEANAKMMTAVMAALKAAGIAEQDVQTSRLALYPVRDNKTSERVTGFQATNQVSIKIRDVAKVADIIDRLVAAGANDISGIQFVVSAPSKPLDQAREAAIADARRKAEIYAKAANVKLGAAFSISEAGTSMPGPITMRAAKGADATPVSVGEQTLRISVSVSYELMR